MLLCQSCPSQFLTPWSLLQHAQRVHALRIYLDSVAGHQGAAPSPVVGGDVAPVAATDGSVAEGVVGSGSAHRRVDIDGQVGGANTSGGNVVSTVDFVETVDCKINTKDDLPVRKAEAEEGGGGGGEEGDGRDNVQNDAEDVEKAQVDDVLCCDDQDCGVTVVPLTHESPRKCCNAVVPKKRKRHMETKHLGGGARREKFTRRPANIYIDLVPNIEDVLKQPSAGDGSSSSSFLVEKATGNERSVIIQPGRTFSIPVRCTTTPPSVSTARLLGLQRLRGLAGDTSTDEVTTASTSVSSRTSAVILDSEAVVTAATANDTETPGGQSRKRRYPTSRPFKCDQCSDAFNQRIHLKKHLSKHTGVKPFKCGQCNYSTVERSHLKVHIRVHTGEKPFRCTFCEYATAQNSTLKIHLKRHHAGTVGTTAAVTASDECAPTHSCKLCGSRFAEAQLLQNHLKDEHGNSQCETQPETAPIDDLGDNVKPSLN